MRAISIALTSIIGWSFLAAPIFAKPVQKATATKPAAQQVKPELKLRSVMDILQVSTFAKTTWELVFDFNKNVEEKMSVTSLNEAIGSLKDSSDVPSTGFTRGADDEKSQIFQYREAEAKFVSSVRLLGDSSSTILYKNSLPIHVATFKGGRAILFTSFASETVFNTLRNDAKQRARKIIDSCLVPHLRDLNSELGETDLDYFGVSVLYGSKDFSDKYGSAKAEMVAIIVSKKDLNDFTNGETSDSELIKKSAVFLSDRDMIYDVKRVDL